MTTATAPIVNLNPTKQELDAVINLASELVEAKSSDVLRLAVIRLETQLMSMTTRVANEVMEYLDR